MFEVDHIYLQWLNHRKAGSLRHDRITVPILWIIAGFNALMYMIAGPGYDITSIVGADQYGIVIGVVLYIVVIMGYLLMTVLPLGFVLRDFLAYLPRAIQDDTDRNIIGEMFNTPVSTREIVGDLLRWAVRMNIRHLLPSIALIIALILSFLRYAGLSILGDSREAAIFILFAISLFVLIALWWAFFLATGLASAALPRWVTRTGLLVPVWLIPVLLIVFVGGYFLADWTLELFSFLRSPAYYRYDTYALEPIWYTWHFIVILMIPTVAVAVNVVRMMEARRRYRWK